MLLKTIKVFNIMSRTNETRHISQHKTCACKGRLDASVCNNKQHWNIDTRRCQYKELIDKGRCYNGSIQNPIICECECDTSCSIGQYLDNKNCKRTRKELINQPVKECSENIHRN